MESGQEQTVTDNRSGRAGAQPDDEALELAPPRYDQPDQLPIAGVWRVGRSGKAIPDYNPYTGETLLSLTGSDARDVDDAYQEAQKLHRAWAAVRPQDRRSLLVRAALILEARKEEILDWLIKESGSTRTKALIEWRYTQLGMLEAANFPFHVEGKILPASIPGKENRVYRNPIGVVGVISPWNFPLHLTNRSVAPALAVGNTVVIKPASDTPVTGGLLLARIFEEAGLPPGVLSVVVGGGKDIGDAFSDHPIPRVISFTGSTDVGRRVAEHAGRNTKRVCLELGGNTPFIVLDDADLDLAVRAAVAGKFLHQGQICLAVNRILVDVRHRDEFQKRFVERVEQLKVGNPADADTAIGPIINRTQLDNILRKVDDTLAQGARALLRGPPSGLVLPPIVLADVTNDMPAAKQEVFGPVAPILTFDGEEEAIRIANDTEYGLSSAVFTRDVERGLQIAKRLEVGMTHINDWPINDEPNTAFGGEKASGLGRFGGEWALDEFTTHHWISVQGKPHTYPI
jgi:aldehyde dehydrogenase (NAD+)